VFTSSFAGTRKEKPLYDGSISLPALSNALGHKRSDASSIPPQDTADAATSDGIVFSNRFSRNLQGVLAAHRSEAARRASPTRLSLDRRQLSECPHVLGETVEMVSQSLDRNSIPTLQNFAQ
jgi:hypothetical protein